MTNVIRESSISGIAQHGSVYTKHPSFLSRELHFLEGAAFAPPSATFVLPQNINTGRSLNPAPMADMLGHRKEFNTIVLFGGDRNKVLPNILAKVGTL
jgi:hypothetical protein